MYIDEKDIEIAIIALLAFTSVLTIIFAYTIRRAEEAITNDNKRKRGE